MVIHARILISKPAVIQQKQFRAEFFRGIVEADDAIEIKVEPG